MKIHRTTIHPKTKDDLVIHLPARFLDTEIEVIAFPVDKQPDQKGQRTFDEAVKFWDAHPVDFSKVEKWKREDLYE